MMSMFFLEGLDYCLGIFKVFGEVKGIGFGGGDRVTLRGLVSFFEREGGFSVFYKVGF